MKHLEIVKIQSMHSIVGAWNGELPLWKVFAFHWSVGAVTTLLGFSFISLFASVGLMQGAQAIYSLTLAFIVSHAVYISVCVWRNSSNVNSLLTSVSAKVLVLVYMVYVLRIVSLIPAPGLQAVI